MLTKQGGANADFIHSRYTILDSKDSIVVKPKSIGQFTGLLDKKGNKIFEGDRVKLGDSVIFIVEFINGSFRFRFNDSGTYILHLDIPKTEEIEIIGNIHENK